MVPVLRRVVAAAGFAGRRILAGPPLRLAPDEAEMVRPEAGVVFLEAMALDPEPLAQGESPRPAIHVLG